MNMWVMLALAIVSEVIATNALKASQGFTKLIPSLIVVVGYVIAFYLVSQVLKQGLSVGVTYAIWAGAGTAATAIIGVLYWKEPMDIWRAVGIGLIIGGVVVLNAFGKVEHG